MALRVAIYARTSTDRNQDPASQVAELKRYCAARDWQVTEEISDFGFSGGTDNRPGLKQLLSLVRKRYVDAVLVVKLDRLARSLRQLISFLDEFSALGVQFISIGDNIDMTSPAGRLMVHLVAAFAEFERCLARERTLVGLAYARQRGKKLGRPKSVDEEAIKCLHAKGLSYRAIAQIANVSRGAVYRALRGVPKTPLVSPQEKPIETRKPHERI